MKTSIYLDDLTAKAYRWLQEQPGGFNLSKAAKQLILKTAVSRGWGRKKKEDK